jgi:hypothetical protein
MNRKIVEYLILEKSFNQIARELKVGKKRIRNLYQMAIREGYISKVNELPPFPADCFLDEKIEPLSKIVSDADEILGDHFQWIKDRIESDWHLLTIYEELPVKVGRSSYYRFIQRHNLNLKKCKNKSFRVRSEIVHRPGEALLLDWGKICDIYDPVLNKNKTLWAFVGILGFSRYMIVKLVWSNTIEETLSSIESMLQEIEGVPLRITSDNPKCFAYEASKFEPILNPVFERFSHHYKTIAELLPPRDPEKKGKVERMMPYVRRLFEAHKDQWVDIGTAQKYLDNKVRIANERRHRTTKLRPIDLLVQQEKANLKPLPIQCFSREEYAEGKVRQDGHIFYKGKYYSVDPKFIGQDVFLIGNKEIVNIFHKGKFIDSHSLVKDPHISKSTKEIHLRPGERRMNEHQHYIKDAEVIGGHVKNLVEAILKENNGFVDLRKIWGILSLEKKFSHEQINEACESAFSWGSLSYQTVKKILEGNKTKNNSMNETNSSNNSKTQKPNKFLRKSEEYSKIVNESREIKH